MKRTAAPSAWTRAEPPCSPMMALTIDNPSPVQGQATFFPRIPVEFTVDAKARHTHIPLLLSPFGYSTYRGN